MYEISTKGKDKIDTSARLECTIIIDETLAATQREK